MNVMLCEMVYGMSCSSIQSMFRVRGNTRFVEIEEWNLIILITIWETLLMTYMHYDPTLCCAVSKK